MNPNNNCCQIWQNKAVQITLGLLSVFLLFYTINIIKDWTKPVAPTDVISISAQGESFAKPDVAEFSVGITKDSVTVSLGGKIVNDKINAVMEVLKKAGVADKDIKTTNYSVTPKYEWESPRCVVGEVCSSGKNVFKGYTVTQTLQIKVRDLEKAGEILSNVGEIGVTNVSGLNFVVDDADKVKEEARNEAIAKAQVKALALAKKLDVKLIRVVGFYEDIPYIYDRMNTKGMDLANAGVSAPMMEATLPAGENKYTSNVSITYEIK